MIFLPTHRSHLDYVLISFALFSYDIRMPHVAAGDNLRIPFFGLVFCASIDSVPWSCYYRVFGCLENLKLSGNLTALGEGRGIDVKSGKSYGSVK